MHDRKFSPQRKEFLDSPERAREYDIPAVISGIGLGKGMAVADIGAGTGFFSIPFSEAVGATGRVFAVDISREMLDVVDARAAAMGLDNVTSVLSTEDSIPIPYSRADMAFMSNVFHELEGDGTLREIRRILKKGGKLAIVDYKKRREDRGPPYHHRFSRKSVRKICAELGFDFEKEFGTGSDRRYGLLFAKR